MRLQDQISFTMLQWVKPQLDEALLAARETLEEFVERPGDGQMMRSCADHLRQVHGTLQMVELQGAALIADELGQLADALRQQTTAEAEEACAVMMRGLMQLPDYLERLSSGQRDVPMVLLPLLNDVRASRRQPPLGEAELFYPNLELPLPGEVPMAAADMSARVRHDRLVDLRLHFQQQLLGWFRGQEVPQRLRAMRRTLLAMAACCTAKHSRRLCWVAAGVFEGLERGLIKGDATEMRRTAAHIDRLIRRMIEEGEASLLGSDVDEVTRKLLYIVAHAPRLTPRMALLRQTYALDELVPDIGELDQARGSMAGYNRNLLDSVSRALKEDLLRVKEALDMFLRQGDGDPAQLAAYGEVLERIGDTLGMLALSTSRGIVAEQRRILDELANGMRAADEETLLDVAGALLGVESSLDDHIQRLGAGEEVDAQAENVGLSHADGLALVSALMSEAIANTAKVKQAIVAFVESGWQHAHLAGTPALLNEVSGAMYMLLAPRPGELALGIGRFVENELLADRRVPGQAQMDLLADALSALEYYLEAARDHRGHLDHTLGLAERGLTRLGYLPVPPAREPVVAPEPVATAAEDVPFAEVGAELSEAVSLAPDLAGVEADLGARPMDLAADVPTMESAEPVAPEAVDADDDEWVDVDEEVFEDLPVRDALAAQVGFNAGAEGIDDDIREIFLEEMQEEIENLRQASAVWQADPKQRPPLVDIRRSFHTLKGSGRLVGASVVGEFAWKVENMLNRVLDNSIEAHGDVQALIEHAIGALPGLLAALKGEGTADAPLSAIMQTADQLAAGQQARVEDQAPAVTEMVRRVVRRRVRRGEAERRFGELSGLPDMPAASVAADAEEPSPQDLPAVDPVLLEILRSEVTQYVQMLRASAGAADGQLPLGEESLRAVHTLHGAIAMVDVPLLTQLLAPLETLFKRLRGADLPLPTDGVRLLVQALDVVDHVMGQFDQAEPTLPQVDELATQLAALCERYRDVRSKHVIAISPTEEAALVEPGEPGESGTPAEVVGVAASAGVDAAPAEPSDDEGSARDDATALSEPGLEAASEPESTSEPQSTSEPEPELQSVPASTAVAPTEAQAGTAADADGSVAREAPPARGVTTEVAGEIDPDLLEVFLEEARELLDHADGVLATWRADPEQTGYVDELRRDLHTLKGGARISGLVPVGDLAHAVETLLERGVPEQGRIGSLLDALETSFDQLNQMVQRVADGQAVAHPQAMLDQLQTLTGGAPVAAEPEAEAQTQTEAAAEENANADESADESADAGAGMDQVAASEGTEPVPAAPPDRGLPELLPEEQEETASTQEQVRVRAGLLDNLVNWSGEVAIHRARLEQQVAGCRHNLVEFDQTVSRLRGQLRMLEIETEAQIIARFQHEHRESGQIKFDPLELDRYSQLQQYSRALAESVSDLASIQATLDGLTRQAESLLVQQSRVAAELQEGLLRARMLPFDSMVPSLRRTLRQAAREQSKRAQLHVDGAHGELDRNLLERIKAPFEHMLRNAIAHGIETPAERARAGKPTDGSVHIEVAREATEMVIRVSDDGRGLDRAAIRARGIERGLLAPEVEPSDEQLLSLITQTGFSTASSVSQLAGRGVGMDVVANEIRQLGGSLAIESQQGQGTTFVLRLPFTFAVTHAILVQVGEATFAIPMTSVQGVVHVAAADLVAMEASGEPSYRRDGKDFAVYSLAQLLGLPPGPPSASEAPPLLLVHVGDLRAAVRVDSVLGSHEIVVKAVGPQVSSVPGLIGATIMADGSVLVILDLAPLVRHGIARRQQRLADGLGPMHVPLREAPPVRPSVMVVDDSITVRKVTGRVLERNGYDASVAIDGVDALEKLREHVPDLILLDIEMPRMDGYELATHMKADRRLRNVPIIMITSRSGDKHRQRALNIGVERYLGKPYQEADLLVQIRQVLEQYALEPGHE
jgi:chemosensory pili system protein ChpA (sensor histidine kinase/response regulator)